MSRLIAVLLVALAPLAAWAHHGWSSFDETRPIYLAGTVESVAWQNPHAEIVLLPSPGLSLPPDLATRSVPVQEAPVDGAKVMAEARLPADLSGSWTIELAPLTRMDAWGVERIAAGATVELVGYTFPEGKSSERIMRVEYLLVDGKAYGLRSLPKR
jgi:hypothetical protein